MLEGLPVKLCPSFQAIAQKFLRILAIDKKSYPGLTEVFLSNQSVKDLSQNYSLLLRQQCCFRVKREEFREFRFHYPAKELRTPSQIKYG